MEKARITGLLVCILLIASAILTIHLDTGVVFDANAFPERPAPTDPDPERTTRTVDSWPMFNNFANNSGYSSSTVPDVNDLLWSAQGVGNDIISSPVIIDGKVYIGSSNNNIYCLDEHTGQVIWRFQSGSRVYSTPAVVDGKVYVGSHDSFIYCIPAADPNGDGVIQNNELHWRYDTAGYVESSPTVVNGMVYCGSNDRHLYCINAVTGNLVWRKHVGDRSVCTPAVVDGKVYTGAGYYSGGGASSFWCFDAATGDKKWNISLNESVVCSPAVSGDRVYFGTSMSGYIFCLPATDPNGDGEISGDEIIWTHSAGADVEASPAVAYGNVYFGCAMSNKVICLDAGTGDLVWNHNAPQWVYSSPAVADGKVVFECENGFLYCIPAIDPDGNGDIAGGEVLWSRNCGGGGGGSYIASSPAIANGRVYVGGGNVFCIGSLGDIVPPRVSFVTPAADDRQTAPNATVTATFNEEINASTLTNDTVMIREDGGKTVPGRISYDPNTYIMTFRPDAQLTYEESYTEPLRQALQTSSGTPWTATATS